MSDSTSDIRSRGIISSPLPMSLKVDTLIYRKDGRNLRGGFRGFPPVGDPRIYLGPGRTFSTSDDVWTFGYGSALPCISTPARFVFRPGSPSNPSLGSPGREVVLRHLSTHRTSRLSQSPSRRVTERVALPIPGYRSIQSVRMSNAILKWTAVQSSIITMFDPHSILGARGHVRRTPPYRAL